MHPPGMIVIVWPEWLLCGEGMAEAWRVRGNERAMGHAGWGWAMRGGPGVVLGMRMTERLPLGMGWGWPWQTWPWICRDLCPGLAPSHVTPCRLAEVSWQHDLCAWAARDYHPHGLLPDCRLHQHFLHAHLQLEKLRVGSSDCPPASDLVRLPHALHSQLMPLLRTLLHLHLLPCRRLLRPARAVMVARLVSCQPLHVCVAAAVAAAAALGSSADVLVQYGNPLLRRLQLHLLAGPRCPIALKPLARLLPEQPWPLLCDRCGGALHAPTTTIGTQLC